ncbi:MAG: undecaprenyl/decaprenyl-phosphate alpha-N-acetylglucosaminyl 1-phosphate transferase [Clostridia bacterium]|nr:undecaprenyl/decaprenyl-phosphate alpha-N-acetylglucosaminyl 1-phosphate transferase [Clostridia bacterium]
MITSWIFGVAAVVCAALLTFSATPAVRVLAYRLNAVDRPHPRDRRRMHRRAVPRIGGLAMFFAFLIVTVAFCDVSPLLASLLLGGMVLVFLGVLDDIFSLKAWVKALVQLAVSFIPILFGLRINFFSWFGGQVQLGVFSIPVTVFWIMALTNAINLIDGLDGLACGVSAISSLSMTVVTILNGDPVSALFCAILAGTCAGFLPFNSNPAKIEMGDTGALFLGYTMAVLSISGLFKIHAAISFLIPLSVFGLPLFDTFFAVLRRLARGQSPFKADHGHLHHRLVEMGFGHRQSVKILYAISGIFGIAAVLLTQDSLLPAMILFAAAFVLILVTYFIMKNEKTRVLSGLHNIDADPGDCPGGEETDTQRSETEEEKKP